MMKKRIQYIILLVICLMSVNFMSAQTEDSLIENQILSAVAKYNEGDMRGAKSLLAEVFNKDQDNDAACYYLASIAIAEMEIDEAEYFLRKAVDLDGSNFWYRHKLARLYSITNRPELAIAIYEQLLKDFPKKSDLYQELVELYAAQNEYDKAIATINEIEKVFGVTETVTVYKFNLLRLVGRQDEAYEVLEEYNRKYSSPYILSTLADWQISMYNDSTALAYYNEALDLDSEYVPAQVGKAEVLRMKREHDGFFVVLNEFIRNASAPSKSKVDYLSAIVQRGDPNFLQYYTYQMDTVMTNLLNSHPKDSLALNLLGVWYYSTSRNELAHDAFQKNVQLYPESFSATASFVEFLMYAGKWEELSVEGRKAFEIFSEEPAFLELASVGDYNLKRYDKVLEICDQILEIAPKDTSRTLKAWSTKGDIYHLKGENNKSYKSYERALKLSPDDSYVLNNYAYYLSEEGKNLKKAYEMSRKTVDQEPKNATYLDTFGWILHLMGRSTEAKPYFKKAMLYGGKDSAVIMDHYADVLFALKEYDMAFVYWNLAKQKNQDEQVKGLEEKVLSKRKETGR